MTMLLKCKKWKYISELPIPRRVELSYGDKLILAYGDRRYITYISTRRILPLRVVLTNTEVDAKPIKDLVDVYKTFKNYIDNVIRRVEDDTMIKVTISRRCIVEFFRLKSWNGTKNIWRLRSSSYEIDLKYVRDLFKRLNIVLE